MSLITTKAVQKELGISRQSVETLVDKGVLRKAHLPLGGKNPKRQPVRYDSSEVEAVKRRILLGEPLEPVRRHRGESNGRSSKKRQRQPATRPGALAFD